MSNQSPELATVEDLTIAAERPPFGSDTPHGGTDRRGYDRRNVRLRALASHLESMAANEDLAKAIKFATGASEWDWATNSPPREDVLAWIPRGHVLRILDALAPLIPSTPKGDKSDAN